MPPRRYESLWHGTGSTIFLGVDVSMCVYFCFGLYLHRRVRLYMYRYIEKATWTSYVGKAILNVFAVVCVNRYIESATLNSYVSENILMLVGSVWLVPLPGEPLSHLAVCPP